MLLYTDDKTKKYKQTMQRCRIACVILIVAALIICITLCILTRTGIDRIMMFSACGVFTLFGWIAIALWLLKGRPAELLSAHMEGILKAEKEGDHTEMTGTISKTKELLHIPNSIDVLWVNLVNDEGAKRLKLPSVFASQLPKDGTRVELGTTRGYIVEVKHASN